MKKIILAIVAIMTMTAAQAQGDQQRGNGERPRVDRTEMLKKRTDDAVKKYGLNEDQAAKLLALNEKYADKMRPGRGGRGGRGMRPRPDFGNGDQGQGGQRPEMTEEMRQRMETMRKEREEATKQYEAELQKIMNEEQFKAYKADQEQMRQNFGRRGNGQRGPGRNREQ